MRERCAEVARLLLSHSDKELLRQIEISLIYKYHDMLRNVKIVTAVNVSTHMFRGIFST